MFVTIKGVPIAKPRMTQADKWQKRPCVLRYRAWKDQIAWACKGKFHQPLRSYFATMRFYLPLTKQGKPGWSHVQKPDIDNLVKGVLDALWPDDDARVWKILAEKRYDDGKGTRLELTVTEI